MKNLKKKIFSLDELILVLEEKKKDGLSIVSTNGSFDVVHLGHVRLLKKAKALGDLLVVGVNSDLSVKRLKGESRPINNENSRMEFLACFEMCDYIFCFNEDDPREFLKKIKPDIHVNSSEYGENCIESEILKKIGSKLILFEREADISSSMLIEESKNLNL